MLASFKVSILQNLLQKARYHLVKEKISVRKTINHGANHDSAIQSAELIVLVLALNIRRSYLLVPARSLGN